MIAFLAVRGFCGEPNSSTGSAHAELVIAMLLFTALLVAFKIAPSTLVGGNWTFPMNSL